MNVERTMKGLAFIALLGGIARIGMAPSATIWGVDSVQELLFGITACLLMGVGIFGVYLHGADRYGTVGFLSVLMISISSTMTACLVWSNMVGVTEADHDYVQPFQNINSLIAILGMIGFCVQTIRARIYPVWTVVLFLLFPVMSFIPAVTNWATAAWGLSYVGFGYYALANKSVRSRPYVDASA
jgi:hypothetical protein